jgi:hypothetical protein
VKGSTRKEPLAILLEELRAGSPRKLEQLAAALFERLLDVRVAIAKSGFQHGGDAGTAGRAGRRLRIECKRYSDSTPLSDRELQGEIDDAKRRTPGLEAWVLVATREVSENTQETLNLKGREVGIPVVIVDWAESTTRPPDLAALCAGAPDLVETHLGTRAATAARALKQLSAPTLERMRRELQPWHIGFLQLQKLANIRLLQTWTNDVESRAAFGQNAAGGASRDLIERKAVSAQLSQWWAEAGTRPAVVYGAEGVGKTWAALQWVMTNLGVLPITLVLPASAFAGVRGSSSTSVMDLLAGALHDLTLSQDRVYWRERLYRLLERPSEDGPALMLFVDGLNQEASFAWRSLIQVLQAAPFTQRVRFLLSTQTHFLEDRLQALRFISSGAKLIGVEPYDLTDGGEFDQILSLHGRRRADLAPELIPLARIPRLFRLATALSADAPLHGDATVSRLLWAYGRDQLSMREGRALTEADWEGWLRELARQHWSAICARESLEVVPQTYSVLELDAQIGRTSLEASLNYRRLEEIIDGTWMEQVPGQPNIYRPRASTIYLALGAELLGQLEGAAARRPDSVSGALAAWIEPIAATSAAADILAAAMSIAVAKGFASSSQLTSAVVCALLQSQNANESHRNEVRALAPAITQALLDAVECSGSRAQSSARHWALDSLRGISHINAAAWDLIYNRIVSWVAHVVCPRPSEAAGADAPDNHFAERLRVRIGTDQPGYRMVMGVSIRVHEREMENLGDSVPQLLAGKPLVPAVHVMVAACVAAAVDMSSCPAWDGFKWVVLLNAIDRPQTVDALAQLAEIARTTVEPGEGVHPEMPTRVAALLLWLTGAETHEIAAAKLKVSFERGWDYEKDYLADPAGSWFTPEYRHVRQILEDERFPLLPRLKRAEPYIGDPMLLVSEPFAASLRAAADSFDMGALHTTGSWTREDYAFHDLLPAIARFAPDAAASMARRALRGLPDRFGEKRRWGSKYVHDFLILADSESAEAARTLRLAQGETADREEPYLAMKLLEIELLHLPAGNQLDRLVEAADTFLSLQLLEIVRPLDDEEVGRFLTQWSVNNRRVPEVILNVLAAHPLALSERNFTVLGEFAAQDSDQELRVLAFIALADCVPTALGEFLLQRGWRASPEQHPFEQERGAEAIRAATASRTLEEIEGIVTPSALLEEASERGGTPDAAKVAARAIEAILRPDITSEPPDDVVVSVEVGRRAGFVSFDPKERSYDDEEGLAEAFNLETRVRKQQEANAAGRAYLERMRSLGETLASTFVRIQDARMLVSHCSAEVERWLDGMESLTPAFRNRLNAAGGLYLALCEALIEVNSPIATTLWHAIGSALKIQFVGAAKLNELYHIPFRAPETAVALHLRETLYELRTNANDAAYMELVICAMVNKQQEWLSSKIEEDATSGEDWRRARAVVVRGLAGVPACDERLEWPEGPVETHGESLRHVAMLRQNSASIARHWWKTFLDAPDTRDAYAAWILFCRYADRRAHAWMSEDMSARQQVGELWRLKLLHIELNRSALTSAMKDNESKRLKSLDQHLFHLDAPDRWLDAADLPTI